MGLPLVVPCRLSGMLLLLRVEETLQIITGGLEKPVVMTPLVREIQQYQSDIGEPYRTVKYKYPDYNLKHFDEEVWCNHDDKDIHKGEREPTSSDCQYSRCTWMTVEHEVAMFIYARFLPHMLDVCSLATVS